MTAVVVESNSHLYKNNKKHKEKPSAKKRTKQIIFETALNSYKLILESFQNISLFDIICLALNLIQVKVLLLAIYRN